MFFKRSGTRQTKKNTKAGDKNAWTKIATIPGSLPSVVQVHYSRYFLGTLRIENTQPIITLHLTFCACPRVRACSRPVLRVRLPSVAEGKAEPHTGSVYASQHFKLDAQSLRAWGVHRAPYPVSFIITLDRSLEISTYKADRQVAPKLSYCMCWNT